MNGVLCAGNKEETNYVIIQLLLVCHGQIKCQIKKKSEVEGEAVEGFVLIEYGGLPARCRSRLAKTWLPNSKLRPSPPPHLTLHLPLSPSNNTSLVGQSGPRSQPESVNVQSAH